MGHNKIIKKYVLISGFNVHDYNRGTAALSYGSIRFCVENGYLKEGQEIVTIKPVAKVWKYKDYFEEVKSGDDIYIHVVFNVFFLTKLLHEKFGIFLPFTKYKKIIKEVQVVMAINGGDGFSDIYNTESFLGRLHDINVAMKENIPVVILPQTLGPFKSLYNYNIASKILKYSKDIFVRDNKFVTELLKMGLNYSITKDLSAYMLPEPWDIDIKPDSIGINVSGLAYSNKFRTLSGQFENYPLLIDVTIRHFQSMGKTIYLIPHSYNYSSPEQNNDDMIACREAFNRLNNKANVVLIDKDLISPQIKYVISKMSFFIGTRMHANFAAIYTGVPLYGMAYSYKFEGAFNANGLDGAFQTAMINNISKEDIPAYIEKINKVYNALKKS